MRSQLIVDIFALGSVVALIVWADSKRRRKGPPLPPGPRSLSLVRNLFSAPQAYEWVVYRDWSRKYGADLIHLDTFGTHTIIVNSARASRELFNKRSALYSDRPALTALREYLGFTYMIAFMGYSPRWRAMRKGVQEYFHHQAARAFEPIEESSVHSMLRDLIESPNNYREHIRHMAGRIILRIAYGIDVRPRNDPFVLMAEEALHAIAVASQIGGNLFDMIPFLQKMPSWFPGTRLRETLRGMRPISTGMFEKAWKLTAAAIEDGSASPSIAATLFTKQETQYKSNQAIPANLYVAGADTTVSSIQSFFLAMVLYPEVQRKAQEELDKVLEHGSRLPTFTDFGRLPYTEALVKEVLRWHPVTPLAIAHRAITDDVYEGWFIPEGSIVIGNTWAILHDPDVFPDPEIFRPEHFLIPEQGGTLPPNAPAFPDAAFGFGRRICPGRHMARSSIWIAVASILASFDIGPVKDKQGRPIPVKEEYTSGIVS
ncbi:CyP450 monooxygenase [Vararia minispora EC-137]|uniref:CyP450 monooxygenase n=1 Tax=Vararia minispora EC-137 TaxID=1314806 RepID=A0ACB8Q9A2_9AGAM|nr:CyP450 monooxygenase [Vararia minispora EC-137]